MVLCECFLPKLSLNYLVILMSFQTIYYINYIMLECGAVKQWELTSLLCAHCCLRIGPPFRTGNPAGARVRSFDLANEARQMGENREMAKFALCPVCKNNYKLL
jgi:hypothetical protein